MFGLENLQSPLTKGRISQQMESITRSTEGCDVTTSSSSRSRSSSIGNSGRGSTPSPTNCYQDPFATHSIGNLPQPTLQSIYYRESIASEFKLRSRTYMKTKKKEITSPNGSLFELLCMDLYELPSPSACTHVASKTWNRVFQATQRGDKEWTILINFIIPGPPFLCLIAYFKGDREMIDNDSTPFSKVAKKFFDGNDDSFRNSRFKVIPRILEGNIFIRMAVQDTPTLLGNKLTQTYYRSDHYFEIDVDVATSAIARNIVGMMKDASKNLVIDLGFVLQGEVEEELPEVLMCGTTIVYIDTTTARKTS